MDRGGRAYRRVAPPPSQRDLGRARRGQDVVAYERKTESNSAFQSARILAPRLCAQFMHSAGACVLCDTSPRASAGKQGVGDIARSAHRVSGLADRLRPRAHAVQHLAEPVLAIRSPDSSATPVSSMLPRRGQAAEVSGMTWSDRIVAWLSGQGSSWLGLVALASNEDSPQPLRPKATP